MQGEPEPISRMEALRGLRISTQEALWATVFVVFTGGAFQIGFARHLGASDLVLGLLAGLPAAVGLLQIPASLYTERRGERRQFVAFSAGAGRLLLATLALVALLPIPDSLKLVAFLILLILSSALLTITVPAWTSWMSDLVPGDARGRYFAGRNRLASIVAMLAPLPAAWLLDRLKPEIGFPLLFGLAAIPAVVCFFLILRQPEPPMVRQVEKTNPLKSLKAPFADPSFRRFLAFAGTVVVGQSLAGQFFMAWQVDKAGLELPYVVVQLIGAVASAASLATMPLWGYLADKYGGRPVLMIGSWLVLISPILWCFTFPGQNWLNYPLMVTMNIVSGAGWAAVGLTQFNLLLSMTPDDKRGTYVAVFSAFTGIIGGVSPIVGGALMTVFADLRLPFGLNNYKVMFLITDVVRVVALVLLHQLKVEDSQTTRFVLGQLVGTGTMGGFRRTQRLAKTTDAEAREETVRELGERKSSLAVEELVEALDDVAHAVRATAARALGEIGDTRAVPSLTAKLFDPAAAVGEEAAHSLGFLGDWSATSALEGAARGPNATVRVAALRALGRLADPSSAPTLIAALNPDRPTRCEAACTALAAIGANLRPEDTAEAQQRLLALLVATVDQGMRLAAARAIEKLASALPNALETVSQKLTEETDPAVLARLAVALSRLVIAHAPEPSTHFPFLLSVARRLEGSGLAYLQALYAAADTVLPPGTLYPLLSLKGMARDEALHKLVADKSLLETYSLGHYTELTKRLPNLARHDDDSTAEEALLALLLLSI
ncbi:MFS transporter [Armatimonas sp.]|uniref:MFS transporter n=1 Tax=Armatimonas sp. TaxID=1872638 RepID=UPI003750D986